MSIRKLFALLAVLLNLRPLAAQDTGEAIIQESWRRYRCGATAEEERMAVTIAFRNRVTEKELTRWIQYGPANEDRIALAFTKPPRERIKALIHRRPMGKDDQWLKLPSQQRGRRVSIGDGASFAGTDLIYEDLRQLAGEDTANFTYALPRSETLRGEPMRVVEATPRTNVPSAYSRRVLWVDATFACRRIEYYSAEGPLKTQDHAELVTETNGRWRVNAIAITNHALGRTTQIRSLERRALPEPPPGVFDQTFLTNERF